MLVIGYQLLVIRVVGDHLCRRLVIHNQGDKKNCTDGPLPP